MTFMAWPLADPSLSLGVFTFVTFIGDFIAFMPFIIIGDFVVFMAFFLCPVIALALMDA